MRIGFVATRLGDVDGVSFEVLKWRAVLERLGHEVVLCAGSLGAESGTRIPEMHFDHPEVAAANAAAFDARADPRAVRAEVERLASLLHRRLGEWLAAAAPDLLIVQNAWAIPMHLPLGLALARLVGDTGVAAIGHHHDYWWERERYTNCSLPDLVDAAFPPDLANIAHVSINSLAAGELRRRRGLASAVIPNVFDFDRAIDADPDEVRRQLRAELDMAPAARLFVQPTRVVPRKGIELAIDLVARLGRRDAVLLITGPVEEDGHAYLEQLRALAARQDVDLRHDPDRFRPSASSGNNEAAEVAHALSDAYLAADVITYPSAYEGFGNALVEAIYFGRLMVVNRYPVYVADIAPLGLRAIELEGEVTAAVVDELRAALADPERRARDAAHNLDVGRRHLGYDRLERELTALLGRGA